MCIEKETDLTGSDVNTNSVRLGVKCQIESLEELFQESKSCLINEGRDLGESC